MCVCVCVCMCVCVSACVRACVRARSLEFNWHRSTIAQLTDSFADRLVFGSTVRSGTQFQRRTDDNLSTATAFHCFLRLST